MTNASTSGFVVGDRVVLIHADGVPMGVTLDGLNGPYYGTVTGINFGQSWDLCKVDIDPSRDGNGRGSVSYTSTNLRKLDVIEQLASLHPRSETESS